MDTVTESAIHAHRTNGTKMTFRQHAIGLYIYDIVAQKENISGNVIDYSFISAVIENKTHFSRQEIEGADLAKILHRRIGRPSQKDFSPNSKLHCKSRQTNSTQRNLRSN
jgi:hypothetical protein